MKKQIALLLAAGVMVTSCNQPKPEETTAPSETVKSLPIETIQSDLSQQCKQALGSLSSGDIDGFVSNMADNVVYRWNSGDSVAGKPAVLWLIGKTAGQMLLTRSNSQMMYG